MREPTGEARRKVWIRLALAGILVVAAAIRLWGLVGPLPYVYQPDEPVNAEISRKMVFDRDPLPHFYDYPSLLYDINAAAYVPYRLIADAAGKRPANLHEDYAVMGVNKDGDPGAMLLGRLITLLFGLGMVVLVFFIAREAELGDLVGAVAALGVALTPDLVEQSRLFTPDTIATFFVLLCVYGALRLLRDGGRKWYVLSGAAAGLAAGTKYNAGLAIVALILAHILREGWRPKKATSLLWGVLACGLTFLATTPAVLFDTATVALSIRGVGIHYAEGHWGMQGDPVGWYGTHLLTTVGPLALLAVAMIWHAFRPSRRPALMVLLVFPLIYLVFIARFTVRNARTVMLVEPFLVLLGVGAVVWLVEAASRRWNWTERARTAVLVVALGACLAMPAVVSLSQSAANAAVPPQELAREWIASNVPVGSLIYFEAYAPYVLDTHPGARAVKFLGSNPPSHYRRMGAKYLVFSRNAFSRFFEPGQAPPAEAQGYEALWREFKLVKTFEGPAGQEIRIYAVEK